MYEQYLRDPSSVGDEWRRLFDNGKTAELPIIPTTSAQLVGDRGQRTGDASPQPAPPIPQSPVPVPGLTPISGPAARLVQNMTDSLSVPTATSFRDINVGTLDGQRRTLNAALAASGKKLSFTHLIGWAIVQAAKQFPVMTHAFKEEGGKPQRFDPQNVGLGLAVDVERKDGTRALVVPVIKRADTMDFAQFHAAYDL